MSYVLTEKIITFLSKTKSHWIKPDGWEVVLIKGYHDKLTGADRPKTLGRQKKFVPPKLSEKDKRDINEIMSRYGI